MYEFVAPKQCYSKLFRSHTVEQSLGSTAAHSARMQHTPVSTVQRMHNEAVPLESDRIYQQVWEEANASSDLVLGVDDFAIKKGHTYNTGIHNLKGETMLDLLPGRKLEALRAYTKEHLEFLLLNPKAVVMDLSQIYHTWISECFPVCPSHRGSFSRSWLCDRKHARSSKNGSADLIAASENVFEGESPLAESTGGIAE